MAYDQHIRERVAIKVAATDNGADDENRAHCIVRDLVPDTSRLVLPRDAF
jgi:hypothetical protein